MTITRRAVVRGLGIGMSMPFMARPAMSQAAGLMARSIPKTGEALPLVGLGTWITFNVGDDSVLMDECAAVIAAFFEGGGRMIDCSPMYGSSQPTIGHGLARIGYPERLFSAEKVWISDTSGGAAQIEASREHWGVARFDLMQVHNLVSWDEHLPALFSMKASGRLRYVGITTSEGRRHREIEQVMASEPIDFVQITYIFSIAR